MPKNAKPSGSSKVLKNGNSQRDVPEPAEKAPLTQKQLLFGVSFTGKTPITLLTEYCQKRGWHKPDIQSKQLAGSKAYTGIVHIKKPNAKDASAVETVVFKAPEDSDVKIERSSAAEARHFAALYALYRFANNQNLKNILPPLCRDYFGLLEKHKAETTKTKAFLWVADPFSVAQAAVLPPSQSTKRKDLPHAGSSELKLSQRALEEVEALLREHIQDLAPSEGQMLQSVASDPAEVQAVSRQLEAMHFQRADVQRAIADVCQLRSSSTFSSPLVNFSTAHNLKDAALEYLLLLLPESALPAGFQNKKPTMTARVHVSQDADALSRSWLAQTIHSDTGFPLPLVQEYLSLAKGDEGLCLDLLVQKSLYAADQGLDGLKRRNSDREGVETRRADEILALKSIYPDSVRQQGQRLVIELANGRAHFHVLYHPASTYPSPKVPPTLYCSTPAAGYINMYLTLQAYRILSTDLEPSLTEGHGVLLELLDILNELVPATLANPPSLLEALPRNPGKSTAPAQQPALAATTRPHQSRTQAGPLSSRPIPNNRMAADLEKLSSTSAYQKMLVARSTLPAWSRQQEIVDLIASNRVTLIAGATGSGKTTQVPTYVLDHEIRQGRGADCSIVVTQPRRLAAIGVATRVAEERISDVGQADSLVGYQIRGERKSGRNCRLLFMTTGVLLRTLGSGQSDLRSVSHVVVDEVHERSLENDILLGELKSLLKRNKKIKVILMSATMDESISEYFNHPPAFEIPGVTFPIQDFYLEDIIQQTGYNPPSLKAARQFTDAEKAALSEQLRSAGINDPAAHATIGMIARSERIPPDLVACTVQYIVATQKNADGSILVFTSGVAEIDAIARAVRLQPCASDLDILTLHANQPNAKQRAIFALSKRQKLIVATNVAETSITIPDARYVIDTGKVKEIRMVDGLSRLLEVWTSRASAKQRRGRAGRTQEGLCFKLYTRWTEDQFAQHTSPEIMRIPLENLVLAVKAAHPEVSPLAFLRTLITVPPLPSIALAESTCNVLGVISGDQVTSLGRFVALLPLDLRLGKLLVLGYIFNCLHAVIPLAALLSAKPLFLAPREDLQAAQSAKRRFLRSESDALSDLSALEACRERRGKDLRRFAEDNFISASAVEEIYLLEREYRSSLETAGFSVSIDAASVADDALLKTLLFASSMNVAKIKLPDATYTSTIAGAVQDTVEAREVRLFEKERVFVHPSSLLFGASSFAGKFLTFGAKQITSKPFIRNCSTLTTVGLLLFANDVTSEPHGLKTTIGDIDYKLKAFPKLAVLIRSMKQLFDSELANQFDNPSKFDAKLLSTFLLLINERS